MSKPDIVVYRGFPDRGAYVWSPFVTKLEARLRFAGVPYRIKTGSARHAPRGKIPYISLSHAYSSTDVAGADTVFLGDSQLISDRLTEQGVLPQLNTGLSPAEKALDAAVKALLEDKLYYYNTHERWNDNYYTMRDKVLVALPYPVRVVVGLLIWRKTNATLYGQGTGRFSAEEIRAFRVKIWRHIDDLLADAKRKASNGDGVFWIFGGQGPTEADLTVFAFIIGGLVCQAGPESASLIRSLPNVVDYARSIHRKYFPDYDSPMWE